MQVLPISAFVFATELVKSLFFLNPKFQFLAIFTGNRLYRFVLDLVENPEERFSRVAAHLIDWCNFLRSFKHMYYSYVYCLYELHFIENLSLGFPTRHTLASELHSSLLRQDETSQFCSVLNHFKENVIIEGQYEFVNQKYVRT